MFVNGRDSKYLLFGIIIILIWGVALFYDLTPALRGAPGWFWPHEIVANAATLLPLSFSLLIYLFVLKSLLDREKTAWVITWAALGSIAISLSVIYARRENIFYELFVRTAFSDPTGWHYASVRIDEYGGLFQALTKWPQFMLEAESYSPHIRTYPPGLTVLFYGVDKLLAQMPGLAKALSFYPHAWTCQNPNFFLYTDSQLASAFLGMLMPFWGGLCALPIYFLGKACGEERAGLMAAGLWPLTPSLHFFMTFPNPLILLFSLLVMILLIAGFHKRSDTLVIISGLFMALSTYLSFSSLPLIFFCGLLTLLYFWRFRASGRLEKYWPYRVGAFFSLGLIIPWIIHQIVFGIGFLDIFKFCMSGHLILPRPYWPWLGAHLYDFMIFMGLPLIIFYLLKVFFKPEHQLLKKLGSIEITGVAMLVTILLMDLLGILRGETGRIWLIFWPPLLLVIAKSLGNERPERGVLPVIVGSQALSLILLTATLIPQGFQIYSVKPVDEPTWEVPEFDGVFQSIDAEFANGIVITDYAGEFIDKDHLRLYLRVNVREWQKQPLIFSFLPVSAEKTGDVSNYYPPPPPYYDTACWSGEFTISEVINLPSGEEQSWWVSIQLINPQTSVPLSVRIGEADPDTQISIGPFVE